MEGKPAVLEAIESLQKKKSVRKIKWKPGLHLASQVESFSSFCVFCFTLSSCQDIRKLIDGQKTTQPTSPDQVNRAIYSYGEYQGRATQLVAFGYPNPKEIICHLLISDGDKTRHSRNILLDESLRYGGVALGEEIRGMTVFHFITEKYWLYDEDSSSEEK